MHLVLIYQPALPPPPSSDLPALVAATRYIEATAAKEGGGDEALARGRVRLMTVAFACLNPVPCCCCPPAKMSKTTLSPT